MVSSESFSKISSAPFSTLALLEKASAPPTVLVPLVEALLALVYFGGVTATRGILRVLAAANLLDSLEGLHGDAPPRGSR